jgi:hypothetical protein
VDQARQRAEVDRNYEAFTHLLPGLLPLHRDKFALMREGEIVACFDKPGEAYRAGLERFADQIFSIQEVTDEPIDLGFWSHAKVDLGAIGER